MMIPLMIARIGEGDMGLTAILYTHGAISKAFTANQSRPLPVYGTGQDDVELGQLNEVQYRIPVDGVFKNMLINKLLGSTIQGGVTININGIVGLNCGAQGLGESNSGVNEAPAVAGDLINFQINPNTSGGLTLSRITVEFHEA